MGAKLQIKILTDKEKIFILKQVISVLYDFDIKYNCLIPASYTYWTDGPIWKLGDSVTVNEPEENKYKSSEDLDMILTNLSNYYSPAINLGLKTINDTAIPIQLNIIESPDCWKEVTISMDRYMAYDCLTDNEKLGFTAFLKNLFEKVSTTVSPYYACLSTEILAFPESPNDITPDLGFFGDYTYLSGKLAHLANSSLEKDYQKQTVSTGGLILTKKTNLMGLGK